MNRWSACVVLTGVLIAGGPVRAAYLELGKGVYGGVHGGRDIDWARFDWICCTGMNVQRLNRLLKLNPRQQYVFSLRPHYHLGTGSYGQCTVLDYTYRPESRRRLLENTRSQVRTILTGIRKPANVRGFAFVEELPGHFAAYKPDSRSLEVYRKQIEQETGTPLEWGLPLRTFIMKKYVAAMREIHRTIRQAAPGKLIFYWMHPNFGCLSLNPKEQTYPYRLEDIVRPGEPDGADGLVPYWRRPDVFESRCAQFAKMHGWHYIVQLSYPSGMRMMRWPDTVRGAFNNDPHNLGVYFFAGSKVRQPKYRHLDDPDLPPRGDPRATSWASHVRRYCNKQGIGNDVVHRHFKLHVRVVVTAGQKKGQYVFHVGVTNPKEVAFYARAEDAVARNVRLRVLSDLGQGMIPPAWETLGDIAPGATRTWRTSMEFAIDPEWHQGPVRIFEAVSANTATGRGDTGAGPVARRLWIDPRPQAVVAASHAWLIPNMGPDAARPTIVLEGLDRPITEPSISDGTHTVTYRGELSAGLRLEIDGAGKARLFPTVVYRDPKLVDDPGKAKPRSEGYTVGGSAIGTYVKSGATYELIISGRGADGGSSLVQLTYAPKGKQLLLHGRFKRDWKTITARVTVPEGATHLARYHVFRYPKKGTVWYGRFEFRRADIPTDGIDVTDQLTGVAPVLEPNRLNRLVYRDRMGETMRPRCRVTVRR